MDQLGLPSGVSQIVLFNSQGDILCDRLIFTRNHLALLDINIKTNKPVYMPLEQVDMDISVTDGNANPVSATFSLSVKDGRVESILPPGARPEARLLRYGLTGNPDTLDPQKTSGTLTFQVTKSLYDTLVEPDEKGLIVPALAESYTTSEDGLLVSFRLRKGVRFHN